MKELLGISAIIIIWILAIFYPVILSLITGNLLFLLCYMAIWPVILISIILTQLIIAIVE